MLKKIASNTISQVFSKVWSAIISIFLISALTKYFSPEMYWQYSKIYNYLSIFTFLFDLWLYAITIREISKNKENAFKIIWNIMTLRIFLWISVILIAISIAFFIPWYNSKLSLISIFIVSLFSAVSLFNSSVLALMQSFMKIEIWAITFVLWKIANLFLIFWVIFIFFPKSQTLNFDLAFILIMICGFIWILLNFVLNFIYANKIVKIRFLFDFDYIKHIFKISLPNWIALFLSTVYFKVDVIIISILEPISKADISIALYSLPMKIVEVLMVIGLFFLNSILPSLSKDFWENNFKKIKYVLSNSFKLLFSMWVFIVVMFIVFWKDIISIIATSDYLDDNLHKYTSYDVMFLVSVVLLFNFLSSLFNYIFIASKNEKILVFINLFVTFINIIGNILLIPIYSFMWAAITTLISQIILLLLLYYFSRKIVKFDFDFLYIIKVLVISFLIFYIWSYMVLNHFLWKYLDLLVYGWGITILFWLLFFLLNKKLIKNTS